MLHSIVVWLLVVALLGAGLFNAIGMRATQDDLARWGYPRWWCRVTGGLEILSAALIALPAGRGVGMALGATIIAAALVTVLRRREFSHTAPLGVFAALLVPIPTAFDPLGFPSGFECGSMCPVFDSGWAAWHRLRSRVTT